MWFTVYIECGSQSKGKREMIFAFLKAGAEIRVIKEASGLSEEEIEKLRKEMK
mgnify:CR=1 FL=1